jgi:hypothetical protein
MSTIEKKYKEHSVRPSDINEHLPVLCEYASKCTHITEAGVRSAVSSYAFAKGLLGNPKAKLIQIDLHDHPNIQQFIRDCANEGISVTFYEKSDLDCPMETTDLLFIDTWHIYGHLKRELARWHVCVNKYIIMHDTTVDEWYGDSTRCQWNIPEQVKQSGYPELEIRMGLWPAIVEFLSQHPEWVIEKRLTNNNGLTILRRV